MVHARDFSFGLCLLLLTVLNVNCGADQDFGRAALLIIDVQDCFLPGGSLAVADGAEIIPVINRIRHEYGHKFSVVALSKDWHLPGHVSFASSHGAKAGDVIELDYRANGSLCRSSTVGPSNFPRSVSCPTGTFDTRQLRQVLWPDHCIQNVTTGPTSADLAESLTVHPDDVMIYKGTNKLGSIRTEHNDLPLIHHCGDFAHSVLYIYRAFAIYSHWASQVDSYSAFFDNGNFGTTPLNAEMKARNIDTVFVTGLALDYCVYYTSMDAHKLGYRTFTILDAARGVDDSTIKIAMKDMQSEGVHLINSDKLENILSGNGSSKPLMSTGICTLVVALLFLSYHF